MNKGKVYLIGAGPGDAELLTVKAARILSNADVVVYDRLVSNGVMDLIPHDAELIDVGKNAGNHPVVQSKINEILRDEALAGKTVVRLKGGDPFVFGRGGEELEVLLENGIEFEVVPGITSPVAVPAYAGIPVTHRDYCSSLHIITGHAKAGSELSIDFDSLVKLNGTLVFMMSVSTIGEIAKGLIKAGMNSDMPCAVIQNGTRTNQRRFNARLDKIEKVIRDNNVKSPAVIVIGKVCELSFDWFDKKCLKGKRIIVTMPENKQSTLVDKLHGLGADTLMYPCIKTEPISDFKIDTNDYSTLVFTSAAGVEAFFEKLFKNGTDARKLFDKKIACIGEKTAKKLMEYGIMCDFVPSVYDGETLGREMISGNFISTNDKLLLLRAENSSNGLIDILKENKIQFCDEPVYRTNLIKHEKLNLDEFDYITFTSASCVDGFVKSNPEGCYKKIKAVCIGKYTANKAKDEGFDVIVSDVATIDSMCDRIRSDLKC